MNVNCALLRKMVCFAKHEVCVFQREPDSGRLKFTEAKRLTQRCLPLLLSTLRSINHCARVGLTCPGKCQVAILLRYKQLLSEAKTMADRITRILTTCQHEVTETQNFFCCIVSLTLPFKECEKPELYLKTQFVPRSKHTPSQIRIISSTNFNA